jgi:plastocyanin
VTVEGLVTGGGGAGPGGAVITLHRTSGRTPKPTPQKRELVQREKTFLPHALAVPVGSTLQFRNEDPIAHDVFSLSPAAPDKFNTGLYKAPDMPERVFDKAGVVELLCDIHTQMQAYVVVVDTPWYAQADGTGAFRIAGVPPGEYQLEAWHEFASQPTRQNLTVGPGGAHLSVAVAGDRRPSAFPKDKQGKPRQVQVGY